MTESTVSAPAFTLQVLHPGNFAMLMASGIISVGFGTLQYGLLAEALFVVALGAWLVLLALSAAPAVLFTAALRDHLLDPRLVFSFFTRVAATGIVGLLRSRAAAGGAAAPWGAGLSRRRATRATMTARPAGPAGRRGEPS